MGKGRRSNIIAIRRQLSDRNRKKEKIEEMIKDDQEMIRNQMTADEMRIKFAQDRMDNVLRVSNDFMNFKNRVRKRKKTEENIKKLLEEDDNLRDALKDLGVMYQRFINETKMKRRIEEERMKELDHLREEMNEFIGQLADNDRKLHIDLTRSNRGGGGGGSLGGNTASTGASAYDNAPFMNPEGYVISGKQEEVGALIQNPSNATLVRSLFQLHQFDPSKIDPKTLLSRKKGRRRR
jgi:DNA repair ATPase RecN